MTTDNIITLRVEACRTIAALGAALDELATIDELLRNPTPHGRDLDKTRIALALNEAASQAEAAAADVDGFAKAIDKHFAELCPSARESRPEDFA